jgi:prolipoprotein diacylglyceryltransferase
MNYETIGVSLFLVLIIASMLLTIIDIKKCKNLSSRQKNNLIFLQLYFPIIGSMIYFSFFKKSDYSNGFKRGLKNI